GRAAAPARPGGRAPRARAPPGPTPYRRARGRRRERRSRRDLGPVLGEDDGQVAFGELPVLPLLEHDDVKAFVHGEVLLPRPAWSGSADGAGELLVGERLD